MGRFTDPHFLRRAKSRKSPKRPALPGAVIWVWAVHRPTPFNLLLFFTSPGALIRGFFQPCLCGAEFGFCGLGTGRFPTLGRKPPHRPSQARETRCFSAGKDGCCAPEGFSLTKPPAWSCTQGETGGAWVRAAGYKKAAVRFCGTAALCFMIRSAENLLLPPPPARRDTWPAGNPPVLWRSPSPIGWR